MHIRLLQFSSSLFLFLVFLFFILWLKFFFLVYIYQCYFINLQESTHTFPANLETIFSPALEPIEVHFEPNADNNAGICTSFLKVTFIINQLCFHLNHFEPSCLLVDPTIYIKITQSKLSLIWMPREVQLVIKF